MAGLSGIVNVCKPVGITSRDAVNRLQRWLKPSKVGHAGTLDPLATGVLVVAVGSATRLVPYIQRMRKLYRATFRLGETSDTDDITGVISARQDASDVTQLQVTTALERFTGRISQVPPQVSAVHVEGRRAYELARAGVDFELEARDVDVYSLHVTDWNLPEFTVEIECGSGTYVRSIGRDVGALLGCGAIMTTLERTAIGCFTLANSLSLENLSREIVSQALQPPLIAVAELPQMEVDEATERAIRCGQAVPMPNGLSLHIGQELAWHDADGKLIGVGVVTPCGDRLQPRTVLPTE